MSKLGRSVAEKLDLDTTVVDAFLADHHVSTSATTPSPSRLRIRRLRFAATKTLTGVNAAGEEVNKDAVEHVPVKFDWTLGSGLHGVGSDKNLRGKSSVLRIMMWALRGRCDLRSDVRSWIEHVNLVFEVDDVGHAVVFDVVNGVPHGHLFREHQGELSVASHFSNDDEFEEVMGSTMMSALRLPEIAASSQGKRRQHAWPTYAGALLIRGDTLDYLVGDRQWDGLPSRLLQMFIGSEWAGARAEASSAHKVVESRLNELQAEFNSHANAINSAHQRALEDVAVARRRMTALPSAPADLDALADAVERIGTLDLRGSHAHQQVLDYRTAHTEVAAQLAAEKARQHQAMEDAVAVRFFQQMRPTMCPRCSAPVTRERRKAESDGTSCSVCTHDLDIEALGHHHVVSTTANDDERAKFADAQEPEGDDDDSDTIDTVTALELATRDAKERLDEAIAVHEVIRGERAEAAQVIAASQSAQEIITQRRDAELALARAEGAAQALAPDTATFGPSQGSIDDLREQARILDSARKILSRWVTDPQRELLQELCSSITRLARAFGMANLTAVELDGAARMKVTTGGTQDNYSKLERGEKMRLKLATAIALIRQGLDSGIGRHPGLLFVDAPGAEEVDDDDFDTMLAALHTAATEADVQVFIGTRHTNALVNLLGEDRCRVGHGTNFVW